MALFTKKNDGSAPEADPKKKAQGATRAASSKLTGGKAAAEADAKDGRGRTAGAKDGATKAERKHARKEKMSKAAKYVLVAIGVAAMLLSVTAMACSGVLNQISSGGEDYHLTGGVAAEVLGVNITEDTVTEQIMATRSSYDTDAAWATYLEGQGLTPETLREQVIDSLARQYLLTQAVSEYGIEVSDEEIDEAWDNEVAQYGSEETLLSIIQMYGYTEDTYRQQLESSVALEKLRDEVAPLEDPSDQEIIDYVNENLDSLNDARRSSHILIKVDSEADDATREEARQKLEDLRAQIEAGEISFADAAKENSEDGSAEDGGDVGWDKLTSFVTEYGDALAELEPGEMSGIVETTYGYHLIQCTELFHEDGEVTSIDQIPENLRDTISDTIASNAQSDAYNAWLDQYVEDAGIEINPMPEEVPYNVDMALAGTEDESADDAADDADASAEGTADDAAASDGSDAADDTAATE